uniref:HTH CENPB-type domain-containing protein n=1 Tax=Panagrolaimus sp. PS1159 TaxID=55785 RepID=A0AC35FFI5_9BILA
MNSSIAYSSLPIPSSQTSSGTTTTGFWPWLHLSPFYSSIPTSAIIPEDKPLDLSSKSISYPFQFPQPLLSPLQSYLSQNPPQQIRSSVIHSTKDAAFYLPTCIQPEISIETPQSHSPPPSNSEAKPSPASCSSSPPNRMSYPREFKLMVIDYYYTNGLNKYRTCKEFQITKSMLNGWLTKADKIKLSKPGALKSGRSGRKPQFPDVEKQLYQMYLERMSQGEKISNRWIRESAKTLASTNTKDLNGMCQFSERWLSNFKRRFGIGTVLHQSAGEAPIQAFYKKFPWLCRRSSISHEHDLEEKHLHQNNNNRGRKVQFPMIEKQLYEIVLERQKTNPCEKLSNKWLQEKAREISKKSTSFEKDETKCAVFSEHWLNNFKKRFGLNQHHPHNQIQSSGNSDESKTEE